MQYDQAVLSSKVENYIVEKGFTVPGNSLHVIYKYHGYFIAYLPDVELGILGCGETIDGAFNDFKENWEEVYSSPQLSVEYYNIITYADESVYK